MNVWKAHATVRVVWRDFEETVFLAEYMRFFSVAQQQNQS
jgi:hypothetical protein